MEFLSEQGKPDCKRDQLAESFSNNLTIDEATALYLKFAGGPLSPTILHPERDQAVKVMAEIALTANTKSLGARLT